MTAPGPPPSLRFLTEWYQRALTEGDIDSVVAILSDATAILRDRGNPVALLVVVNAPTDQVFYAVFAADSADSVTQACRHAGWAPDRITGGVQTRIPADVCARCNDIP